MPKYYHKSSHKSGLAPGMLVYVGTRQTRKVRITLVDYDETSYEEREVKTVAELVPYRSKPTTTWVDIQGVDRVEVVEEVGRAFEIHSLILEDVVNTAQRPKSEVVDDDLYVVMKLLSLSGDPEELTVDQISIVARENLVITFRERPDELFAPIRKRIKETRWRPRKLGADYLVYALMDAIVDDCLPVLERVGERVEQIEEELRAEPRPRTLHTIHRLKQVLLLSRRAIWPLRETVASLVRGDIPFFGGETRTYLRDLYDHAVQVIEAVENYKEMVTGMHDLYLSSISNKTNEVMKVLTIIATIFIPLTFIAGIYGMNFGHMPELGWRYGYFAIWGVMVLVAVLMMLMFKRKGWL